MCFFLQAPSQIQDQFSALSHHDLRLAHPSIQQWLQVPKRCFIEKLLDKNHKCEQYFDEYPSQTSPMNHGLAQPPSPIKDEPMSPG